MADSSHGWSSYVKNMFDYLGIANIFAERNLCDTNILKEKILLVQNQEWLDSMPSKPKLRTYVKFKPVFETEFYVKSNLSRSKRSLIAQLRSGVLGLSIETGRFKRLEVTQRICEFCNTGVVEDEYHFVCVCPFYENLRCNLFRNCDNISGEQYINEEGFVFIMRYRQRDLSNFIENAWTKRKNMIFGTK